MEWLGAHPKGGKRGKPIPTVAHPLRNYWWEEAREAWEYCVMGNSHSCGTQIYAWLSPDSGSHPINPINSLGPERWLWPKTMGWTSGWGWYKYICYLGQTNKYNVQPQTEEMDFLVLFTSMNNCIFWAAAIETTPCVLDWELRGNLRKWVNV